MNSSVGSCLVSIYRVFVLFFGSLSLTLLTSIDKFCCNYLYLTSSKVWLGSVVPIGGELKSWFGYFISISVSKWYDNQCSISTGYDHSGGFYYQLLYIVCFCLRETLYRLTTYWTRKVGLWLVHSCHTEQLNDAGDSVQDACFPRRKNHSSLGTYNFEKTNALIK